MSKQPELFYGPWHTMKYTPIQRLHDHFFALYLSVGLLARRFGINLKTLRNGISRFNQGKSRHYHFIKDREAINVNYESLPASVRAKTKLPADPRKAYEVLKGEYEMQEDVNTETEILHLKANFEDAYNNRWPQFQKYYEKKIKDTAQQIQYSKSHSLIVAVLAAYKEKWPTQIIFSLYEKIVRGELDALQEMAFSTVSPVYFWRVMRACRKFGIAQTLVHGTRGVPREYKVKMTGVIKAFIRLELRKPQRLLIAEIIANVFKKYNVELSPSSIKSFKAKNENRNILEYDSDGNIWSRQNGMPKITRFLAEGPGEIYQGDYYKLQFVCRKATGIVVRLWAFVVLDCFSKRVVGWALAEEMSATLAKDAFKMAFKNHCFLPEEIVVDNDKYFDRPVFKRFFRRLNNMGVITTKAYPNVPTWKAEIESFFAVFQKLHSSKPWYIGEGVKSKNKAGNPNEEYVKSWVKKDSQMLSIPEQIKEFGKMIEEYNLMTNARKKKVSPSETFRMYKSKRTIKWEHWMESLLFWKSEPTKRIKKDGRIDLQINKVEYCYQVTKDEMLWKYKNSDVRMCYDATDMSRIHIFERKTLKFIGEIFPRMVMTRDNKEEVSKKQKAILNDAHKYARDLRKADEDLVNGKKGRRPVKRETREDKLIRRRMKQAKREKEVAAVKVHS